MSGACCPSLALAKDLRQGGQLPYLHLLTYPGSDGRDLLLAAVPAYDLGIADASVVRGRPSSGPWLEPLEGILGELRPPRRVQELLSGAGPAALPQEMLHHQALHPAVDVALLHRHAAAILLRCLPYVLVYRQILCEGCIEAQDHEIVGLEPLEVALAAAHGEVQDVVSLPAPPLEGLEGGDVV